MTEQEQFVNDEAVTKDVITYVKTENDIEVSVAQLAEDPKKLSIDNGRWVIDIPKKFAICLSEEFEQSVMSCTHHCQSEWGGYIVGHDIKWTNPENNRQVRILIALRAVVIAQSRTGASVEIRQKETEEWMDSDDDESPMAFKTVFAKNKWQKIGWVHSHADLGTFWSSTDTDTMEDMRGVSCLLSIVYARDGKNKLDRRVRVDVNDVLFGGKYNLYMDEIDESFIYSEGSIQELSDVPADVQKMYKEIISNTKVVETASHSKPGVVKSYTQSGGYGGLGYYQGGWKGYQQSIFSGATKSKTTETGEKISEHAVVHGNLSDKAKDEIIEFGNFHYALPEKKRSNLTIADFFVLLDNNLASVLKQDDIHLKWKMKSVVEILDKQQILNIIAYYAKSEVSVQLAMKAYHNFKDFTKKLIQELKKRFDSDSLLKIAVVNIAGDNWDSLIQSSLVDTKIIQLQIDNSDEVIEKVVKEEKPIAYLPDEKFLDWKDFYILLPKKYKMDLWDTVFNSIDTGIELSKKIIERGEVGITTELRGDEDKYLEYASVVYENLVDMWNKTPDKYKDAYRNFYTSYYRSTFSPYFVSRTYWNNDAPKLQKLLNALDEAYVKQFVNDFIVMYETEEELERIVKKYPDAFTITKQTFKCSICSIEWLTKDDALACEEECNKRGRVKTDAVLEVEAKSTSKKEEELSKPITTTTLESGGTTGIGSIMREIVYGTSIKYFKKRNVCNYCGTLYDTVEAAELCEDNCNAVLDDVKTWCIDKDDVYLCEFCNTEFNDELPAIEHGVECPEYGTILDYLINLMVDISNNPDEVIHLISNHFLNKQGSPAPFIDWLLDKGRKNLPIFICEVCGKNWNSEKWFNMKNALLIAYTHEQYCSLNPTEKNNVVKRCGSNVNCGVCEDYTYSTNSMDLMMLHLYTRHGLHPTVEQIQKTFEMHRPTTTLWVGNTENALFLEDGFACRHCTEMYITPERLLKHVIDVHEKVVLQGEYSDWTEHDRNLDLLFYGKPRKSLDSIIEADEKEKASEIGVNEFNYLDDVDLDDIFDDWIDERDTLNIPYNVCHGCGLEFGNVFSEGNKILDCFHHELECRGLIGFMLDDFKCSICGAFYRTISDREICEMEHLELD